MSHPVDIQSEVSCSIRIGMYFQHTSTRPQGHDAFGFLVSSSSFDLISASILSNFCDEWCSIHKTMSDTSSSSLSSISRLSMSSRQAPSILFFASCWAAMSLCSKTLAYLRSSSRISVEARIKPSSRYSELNTWEPGVRAADVQQGVCDEEKQKEDHPRQPGVEDREERLEGRHGSAQTRHEITLLPPLWCRHTGREELRVDSSQS